VSGNATEELDATAAFPVKAGRTMLAQVSPVLDRLVLSRVGRTLQNDQALLYA
jgi:hypothetical protein